MPRMILPSIEFRDIIRDRRERRIDRKDEVWNGVYVIAPIRDNVHFQLNSSLGFALIEALGGRENAKVLLGGNITDRQDHWTKNYRCPDLLVFLPGCSAEPRVSHYFGGPDFAVEILTPNDRSRKKFEFYAKVGVRELLIVDRDPWKLELHRLDQGKLTLVGVQALDDPQPLRSEVLQLSLQLAPGQPRPEIVITRDGGVWRA